MGTAADGVPDETLLAGLGAGDPQKMEGIRIVGIVRQDSFI